MFLCLLIHRIDMREGEYDRRAELGHLVGYLTVAVQLLSRDGLVVGIRMPVSMQSSFSDIRLGTLTFRNLEHYLDKKQPESRIFIYIKYPGIYKSEPRDLLQILNQEEAFDAKQFYETPILIPEGYGII